MSTERIAEDVATLKADLARMTRERDTFREQVETCNATRYREECDALAAELVDVLVRRKVIDFRSPAADALLDYRNPPMSARSDRLVAAESEVAALRKNLDSADESLLEMAAKVEALEAERDELNQHIADAQTALAAAGATCGGEGSVVFGVNLLAERVEALTAERDTWKKRANDGVVQNINGIAADLERERAQVETLKRALRPVWQALGSYESALAKARPEQTIMIAVTVADGRRIDAALAGSPAVPEAPCPTCGSKARWSEAAEAMVCTRSGDDACGVFAILDGLNEVRAEFGMAPVVAPEAKTPDLRETVYCAHQRDVMADCADCSSPYVEAKTPERCSFCGGAVETAQGSTVGAEMKTCKACGASWSEGAPGSVVIIPTKTPEDANERYERLAEEFRRDTGMMAPGKDDRAGGHSPDERQAAWNEWRSRRPYAEGAEAKTPDTETCPHGYRYSRGKNCNCVRPEATTPERTCSSSFKCSAITGKPGVPCSRHWEAGHRTAEAKTPERKFEIRGHGINCPGEECDGCQYVPVAPAQPKPESPKAVIRRLTPEEIASSPKHEARTCGACGHLQGLHADPAVNPDLGCMETDPTHPGKLCPCKLSPPTADVREARGEGAPERIACPSCRYAFRPLAILTAHDAALEKAAKAIKAAGESRGISGEVFASEYAAIVRALKVVKP